MASARTRERPTSREARAEETRQRLIAVAMDYFSSRNYDEVAVSEIAEEAGVAHGVLFHHFRNKRGLYLEAMRRAARELDMMDKIVNGLPPGRQLRQLLESHVDHLARHRGLALRLVLGGRGIDPEAWELFESGRWRIINWFCVELGLDPRSDALRMTLRAAVAAMDEVLVYWLTHDQPYDAATITDVLVDLAMDALHAAARLDPSLDAAGAITRVSQDRSGTRPEKVAPRRARDPGRP